MGRGGAAGPTEIDRARKEGGTRALDDEQGPGLTTSVPVYTLFKIPAGLELGNSGMEFLLNLLLCRGSYSSSVSYTRGVHAGPLRPSPSYGLPLCLPLLPSIGP